jgi:hypothetical protein
MKSTELTDNDLRYVVTRLPRDVRDLLTQNPNKLFLGGGFIRATIAGETPSDIDLFGPDRDFLDAVASLLASRREGSKVHKSKNAITLLTHDRLPVQFITRWTFNDAASLVASFDFTVCQAAIYRGGKGQSNDPWRSATGAGFYVDLAGRHLVYTNPVREEEAGGSMLRVIKYVKRGYTIQVSSLGQVIARLADKVDYSKDLGRVNTGQVIAGMLREVDPLLVVDGLDVVDDHEPEDGNDPAAR